ncbi:MAG TPA: hypothetical protein VFW78_05045 [Bacteroidia bacterium]|nr:hypothetical protein [Bacteroidia bacterium]
MKKFIVMYHAPSDATMEMGNASPEEQKKGMEAWMTWAANCGKSLVDIGSPLANGQLINPDGSSQKGTHNVVGYSVLQAENMEEAKKLLKGHPHLGWNAACSIQLHETMPIPGT